MRYKKFLLIPILIALYIFFINILVSVSFAPSGELGGEQPSGGMLNIGVSAGASVSVVRPYFFGLLELPVYTSVLGDISFLHNAFFAFISILTLIFVIIEWRKKRG